MESKYLKRLTNKFPSDFGVNTSKKDPLRAMLNEIAIQQELAHYDLRKNIEANSVNTFDPTIVSQIYYTQLNNDVEMKNITITPDDNSNSIVVEDQKTFLSNYITGFDFVEEIEPSGLEPYKTYLKDTVFPSGNIQFPECYETYLNFIQENPSGILSKDINISEIVGICRGFDWDNPKFYLTMRNKDNIYEYPNTFLVSPTGINYTNDEQSFENGKDDEWLTIVEEPILEDDILPSFNTVKNIGDLVKVAYLKNIPVSGLKIIDVNNTYNPLDSDSDGIVVDNRDYSVNNNKIIFSDHRSDYNPKEEITNNIIFSMDNVTYLDSYVYTLEDYNRDIHLYSSNVTANGPIYHNDYIEFNDNHTGIFETSTDFNKIDILNNSFELFINGKYPSQCVDNNFFLDIQFNNDRLKLAYFIREKMIIIKFDSDIEPYFIDTDLDLREVFGCINISYSKGLFSIYVNDVLSGTISKTIEVNSIINIKIDGHRTTDNKFFISDFIICPKFLSTQDKISYRNYMIERCMQINSDILCLSAHLFLSADNVATGRQPVIYSKNDDENIFAVPSGLTDENYIPLCVNSSGIYSIELFKDGDDNYYSLDSVITKKLSSDNLTIIVASKSDENADLKIELKNNLNQTLLFEPKYIKYTDNDSNVKSLELTNRNNISVESVVIENKETYNAIKLRSNGDVRINDTLNYTTIADNIYNISIKGNNCSIYDIIIFNKVLNSEEMKIIENYFGFKYGITLNNFFIFEDGTVFCGEITQGKLIVNESSQIGYIQPDNGFNSSYIAEYIYKAKEKPRYLTGINKFYNLTLLNNIKST